MPCTTILVGKAASYDGSTMMARNEDSGAGSFTPKKFITVLPEEQPRHYKAVISGVEIDLPENPMRYTAMPNALPDEGIWGEAGVNEANVAMSETETLTSNAMVLGADPLVKTGIGEEDMLTIVLPYIRSAREGVLRLGSLIEQYGTYEMNGIGFQDAEEIWWLESVGGHHWIAKRVPDDCYVVMPNQQGIDSLDLADAMGEGLENLCSRDLCDFIRDNFLDRGEYEQPLEQVTDFDTRAAFGSHTDFDHSYNTPRAWFMLRWLNPNACKWDGPDADYRPEADDLPWCAMPEHRITVEDVKYVLSGYYQGTPYNPYNRHGDISAAGKYRPIGINRNNFVAITQLRPYAPDAIMAIEWIGEGSNAFNQVIPFYANVNRTPAYLRDTQARVTTENFYWVNRVIGALADAHYHKCIGFIERYQLKTAALGHKLIAACDAAFAAEQPADASAWLEEKNEETAALMKQETEALLDEVLLTASNGMKNAFGRSDA